MTDEPRTAVEVTFDLRFLVGTLFCAGRDGALLQSIAAVLRQPSMTWAPELDAIRNLYSGVGLGHMVEQPTQPPAASN